MRVYYAVCCGLDIHKKTVVACLRRPDGDGGRVATVRTFATTTSALGKLAKWLADADCTHVAMESTRIYWRPVYQILEEQMTVLLVNAAHVSKVPGRKTDVKDCEWLAQLLEHGLLRGSFVPPPHIRELRELTRSRRQLINTHSRAANRVQKVLETANVKLGDVATDVLGVSGRAMLKALIAGERDAATLADLARGRLRDKRSALEEALASRFTDHHAFILGSLLAELEFLEDQIRAHDARIAERSTNLASAFDRLDTIPGVARRAAEQIVAELGDDMARFPTPAHAAVPTPAHAASWTGICPGNHESAGKRRTVRTTKGNRWLRATLVECARGAVRKRDCYLAAQYRRLAKRRGDKRAIVAVAHSILAAAWHILHDGVDYRELGGSYFDSLQRDQLIRYHRRRLADLGIILVTEPAAS